MFEKQILKEIEPEHSFPGRVELQQTALQGCLNQGNYT